MMKRPKNDVSSKMYFDLYLKFDVGGSRRVVTEVESRREMFLGLEPFQTPKMDLVARQRFEDATRVRLFQMYCLN